MAVKLAPADPRARVNYAAGLARAGRRAAAIAELRETVRRQPDWEPAGRQLAALLAADGDPGRRAEAVALAEQLARKGGTVTPETLSTLAVTYEGVGRFADALRAWDGAIAAALSNGQTELVTGLEAAAAACRERATRESP